MKLIVLGSSSKGNCYVLDNGIEALAIECGVSFIEVKRALDFDVTRIQGAIVSHEHGDHAKNIEEFLKARIKVYMSEGTCGEVKKKFKNSSLSPNTIKVGEKISVGGFKIMPFVVKHDATEPFGFLINHNECGTVLFATDTRYLTNTFKGLNNILIECNYEENILQENFASGRISKTRRDRVIMSHLSLTTCKETLLANDLRNVNNIVLIHLSDDNSNAEEMKKVIRETTCKNVIIAKKGMIVENFDKTPF